MSDFNNGFTRAAPVAADMSVDAGLRTFMLGVYNKLALGLLWSAVLAYLIYSVPAVSQIFYSTDAATGRLTGITLPGIALQFAPLVILLGAMFGMKNPSPRSSGILYWTIVTLIGASASMWLIIYQLGSVAATFFITAAAFGALSLVGYTTKKDLTGFGSFLIMAMFGLIAASLVQMFVNLPGLSFAINVAGVLIFAGLIAYDTQRLKMTYYALGGNRDGMSVATNYGALSLYINFINLFQFLLSLFGSRR
ncbi:MAG TPA: Bax inhibitor-1/YccA family protein [Caulobacteraceae bacterium]